MALASQPISLPQPSALPAAQLSESPLTAESHRRNTTQQALLAPIRWWHLLSLDAPTVAALWAFCFAHAFHLTLSPYALPLLFAGTWLIYVADRILDGLHAHPARLRDRHLFYIRHRVAIAVATVPIGSFLVWLVLFHMLPAARRADVLIFGIAAAYFTLVHLCGPAIERWFPKELIVALVFASATAVPALTRITPAAAHNPALDLAILALLSALFASLCWLNCIAIDLWEQFPRRAARLALLASHPSIADHTTRWGQRHLRIISSMLAAASLGAAAILLRFNPAAAALCLASAAAALLLGALDRSPFSALHLRIAADAALLTPFLILFVR